MINDQILFSREQRKIKTISYAQKTCVVTLKANVPGPIKNIFHSHVVISYFTRRLSELGLPILEWYFGEDGLTVYFETKDGVEVKKVVCKWEEELPIGRLVDIDVTLKGETHSLSRLVPRKCFLCESPAFVCGRNRTHTISQLLTYFIDNSEEFFRPIIVSVIKNAMLSELNLENKFGLVSPLSNGSHKDMNSQMMKKAIEEICLPLSQAFFEGLKANQTESLMAKLIPIGLECEKLMIQATNGANAYKGFIFAGGLLLASVGFVLGKGLIYSDISRVCAEICNNLPNPTSTFGYQEYQKGFGGIRKNAKSGFQSVFKAQKLLLEYSPQNVLAKIVGEIEDSVLLKRAGNFDRYLYFKNLISKLPDDEREMMRVTDFCVQNNISIGGSADVLICAFMMDEIKKQFSFAKE